MNKLPKQKRDQLILVVMGTVMVVVAIWFGLINSQEAALARLKTTALERTEKVKKANSTLIQAQAYEDAAEGNLKVLRVLEETMSAKDDPFAWMAATLRMLGDLHNINIRERSKPTAVEVAILPNFPYKAVLFRINGFAYYHDFGKFVSDFENSYPFARVQNIELVPTVEDKEKLSFTFEIVTLVASAGQNGL